MYRCKVFRSCVLKPVLFLLFLNLSDSARSEMHGTYAVSIGMDAVHGDFGTGQNTDSYWIPVSIEYSLADSLYIAVSVPYIYQSNNLTLGMGNGRLPVSSMVSGMKPGSGSDGAHGTQDSSMGPSSGPGRSGDGSGSGSRAPNNRDQGGLPLFTDDADKGLGDITLNVDYTLFAGNNILPIVGTQLYIKFPTADETRNLGTGAYDYGAGLSLSQDYGVGFYNLKALYISPGSSTAYDLEDYWNWAATATYPATENLFYSIRLSGSSSPFADGDSVLDLELSTNFLVSNRTEVGCYLATGLNGQSADYSAGVFARLHF